MVLLFCIPTISPVEVKYWLRLPNDMARFDPSIPALAQIRFPMFAIYLMKKGSFVKCLKEKC